MLIKRWITEEDFLKIKDDNDTAGRGTCIGGEWLRPFNGGKGQLWILEETRRLGVNTVFFMVVTRDMKSEDFMNTVTQAELIDEYPQLTEEQKQGLINIFGEKGWQNVSEE